MCAYILTLSSKEYIEKCDDIKLNISILVHFCLQFENKTEIIVE